jgi:uncharacterized RDD family membrane protein YckC
MRMVLDKCPACGEPVPCCTVTCVKCGASLLEDKSAFYYAGFGRRLAAWAIDMAVLGFPFFIILAGTLFGGLYLESYAQPGIYKWLLYIFSVLVLLALGWLYFALLESSIKQATVGKMALGIVAADAFGRRLTPARSTARYFLKLVSFALLGAGCLMILFNRNKQGLHDRLAGTLVTVR